jgi:sialate O-acetylesterase
VPIGLIQTAWGGTPIEAWTRLGAITEDPGLMPVIAEWARGVRRDLHWRPGSLFNAMVAPLTKIRVKGVIWYQGEANTAPERAPSYGRLLEVLIRDWRRAWGHDLPFLFVQLANYNGAPDGMWPEVREAQRQALALSRTGMAVATDIGEPDDIHPRNKRDVGYRLSLAARAVAYGEALDYSGPLFRRAIRAGTNVRVWFDHAHGLQADGGVVKGFEVADRNGRFVPGQAVIDGETVVVSHPRVRSPMYVRYAWKDNPEATLRSGSGLPAAPFRSDIL